MNKHNVKKLVGPRGGAIVMFLLVTTATNENIAQATHHECACFFRACGMQQRQNLVRKFLSSKREEFDAHRNRPQVVERHSNHLLATVERALDGDSFVMTYKLICFVDSERR